VSLARGPEAYRELERGYERRFANRADYRRAVWALLTASFFQRFVPASGSVLELGCGWGEFITQIRAARKLGMDLNPASRARLGDDVEFLHQDCAERWPLDDASLDTVFTSNFFEHLPDKASLGRTLREAFRCLKPGGRLICLGPNIRVLAGAYWDFWDHYLPLTDRSLSEGLELTGFRIERAVPRFLPYTMARDRNPPLWTVALYIRLPVLWSIFGRQILVIAQRP
jgi:SAM-dependent methyltransferase